MPASREPWVKLKIGFRRSDKVASLVDDSARLGWVYVLLEAKVQRRMGVFASRAHLASLLGTYGECFDDWVAVGLLHVAPTLCAECLSRHGHDELRAGDIVVHDYLLEQRDPTNAERQAAWREKQREGDITPSAVTQPKRPPERVTAGSVTPPPRRARPNANVTADSRAGGTTATATETETTKKNVSDEAVGEATVGTSREAVAAPHLSGPPPSGRTGASTNGSGPRPAFTVPPGIAAATPSWRTPCTNYVGHHRQHRIIGGQAVCEPCEAELAAAAKPNGADHGATDPLGL